LPDRPIRSRKVVDRLARVKVSEVGEFGLIDRLRLKLGEPEEGEVWAGDDSAVIRAPAGTIFFTTDLMVEGVHFDLTITGPEDLGYKALAVNLSDVAAMGGTAWRAVVSLGLRPDMDVEWLEDLYSGMAECASEFSSAVVGGDISRSDCLTISVAVIGNPLGRRVILREGARVGDRLCVTGVLGASAAGYRLLRAGRKEREDLIRAHLRPTPRIREAEVLRRFLPSAMIDISDGFAADLHHLCEASGVGTTVEADLMPVVDLEGLDLDRGALELALGGGEDYELLFTLPEDRVAEAAQEVENQTSTSVTSVGEITQGGVVLRRDGREEPLEVRGWDHLKT